MLLVTYFTYLYTHIYNKPFFQVLLRPNNERGMARGIVKISSSSSAFYKEILSLWPHAASVPSIPCFLLAPLCAQTCSNKLKRVVYALRENFISDQLSVSSVPLILSATRQSLCRLLVSFPCFFWYMRFILWLPVFYWITTCTARPLFCLTSQWKNPSVQAS